LPLVSEGFVVHIYQNLLNFKAKCLKRKYGMKILIFGQLYYIVMECGDKYQNWDIISFPR